MLDMAFHLDAFLYACPIAFWPHRGSAFNVGDDPLDAAEYRIYQLAVFDQLISQVPAFSFFNARHRDAPAARGGKQGKLVGGGYAERRPLSFWRSTSICSYKASTFSLFFWMVCDRLMWSRMALS
jgi:hypothetical protein